ncbi:DUF2130 domain-containing protein [Planctomycetota bacterium]
MADQTIKCPQCAFAIPLTEVLTGQIESSLQSRFAAASAAQERVLAEKRAVLVEQEKRLKSAQETLEAEVEKRLAGEQAKLRAAAIKKAIEDVAEKTAALEEELKEKAAKLSAAQKLELELRKNQQQLEERQENLDLEVQRKVDEQRKKIVEDTAKRSAEEQQLKLRQKDDLIKSMEARIGDLQRRIETGSQEAQGEALEGELKDTLQQAFPFDLFEDIKKGQRGADILQRVRNRAGKDCGSILWESKNTKDFQKPWIDKLKGDQRQANADIGVIMSMALPKEIEGFGLFQEVWVTNYRYAVSLATAFRETLQRVTRERVVSQSQDSAKDILYQYVTGQEFSMQVKAIIDAFTRMQEELDKEKRAMLRIWASREKQIQAVIENVINIRGSIEGYVGESKALPEIEALSLEAVTESDEDLSLAPDGTG